MIVMITQLITEVMYSERRPMLLKPDFPLL